MAESKNELGFKEVTIKLGFWSDYTGYELTEEQWTVMLFEAVEKYKLHCHYSVDVVEHTWGLYE